MIPEPTETDQDIVDRAVNYALTHDAEPLTITGQRSTAVLVGEEDWRAIQETLDLASIPGMTDSVNQARAEGAEAGSETLNW